MNVSDLKKYKDGLYGSLSRELSGFEKNFILISSGILAFSITFINDIVEIKDAKFIWTLFSSWLLFAVAVGTMMFAYLKSAEHCYRLWNCVDDFIVSQSLFDESQNLTQQQAGDIKTQTKAILHESKETLKNMRRFAIWSLLCGTVTFAFFIGVNLYEENTKGSNSSIEIKLTPKTKEIRLDDMKLTTNDSILVINRK